MLPGHTLLMLDFMQASNTVIGSNDIRGVGFDPWVLALVLTEFN